MMVEESGILRLRLIGLDQIIQNVAEEAYRQVKEYQDVVRKEGDTQISNRYVVKNKCAFSSFGLVLVAALHVCVSVKVVGDGRD